MNQRQIGIIVLIVGLALAGFLFWNNNQDEKQIRVIANITGSCYLQDGTCLHSQQQGKYLFGGILSASLLLLGLYLIFFDRTQVKLAENQMEIASALRDAKMHEKSKNEFQAFLAGFSEEEKNLLRAINEEEGISQSTLRYKTGMSKTSLSLLLKSLEDRNIISRKPSGKTNKVYLRKKF